MNAFTIKRSKIRGVESNGMICAEDEIGIGTDHNGIIVLPADAVVGTLAKDYYNVKSDYVLEVDITPNRVDATSHFGVARDLAAYLKQNGKPAELRRPSVDVIQDRRRDTGRRGRGREYGGLSPLFRCYDQGRYGEGEPGVVTKPFACDRPSSHQ